MRRLTAVDGNLLGSNTEKAEKIPVSGSLSLIWVIRALIKGVYTLVSNWCFSYGVTVTSQLASEFCKSKSRVFDRGPLDVHKSSRVSIVDVTNK